MLIEITGTALDQGVAHIYGVDVSEENLQRIERLRTDDSFDQEIDFVFDTKDKKTFTYFSKWLHSQKVAENAATYGDAIRSTIGTITNISGKYRSWE
jgi:hypothetical protein